jgi:hypothetical protein
MLHRLPCRCRVDPSRRPRRRASPSSWIWPSTRR